MVVKPYSEVVNGNVRIRTFDSDIDSDELVWHRDRKTRTVIVLESDNWKFQMDDELPRCLNIGDVLNIPKETYHRVIAGKGKLVVRIEEHG